MPCRVQFRDLLAACFQFGLLLRLLRVADSAKHAQRLQLHLLHLRGQPRLSFGRAGEALRNRQFAGHVGLFGLQHRLLCGQVAGQHGVFVSGDLVRQLRVALQCGLFQVGQHPSALQLPREVGLLHTGAGRGKANVCCAVLLERLSQQASGLQLPCCVGLRCLL